MKNLKKLSLSELQMITKANTDAKLLNQCIKREFKKNDYIDLIADLEYYDTYSKEQQNETNKKWKIKNPAVLDYLQRFI